MINIIKQLKYLFLFHILALFTDQLCAQVKVSGTVYDADDYTLPAATIRVLNKDSALLFGEITNANGQFTISLEPFKKYTLLFSYLSYKSQGVFINLKTKNESIELGKIVIKDITYKLREVEIKAAQERGTQNGDTTSFNANAFKTHPDATAEDLVKKMPGITSDNSGVKVNGENVQKVLVDGKPFFGDDPGATLKNLPAEIIEKVEVFDKASDQSQFTGFNDGQQQKTINLITKKDKAVGKFGKVYGGAGIDDGSNLRYHSGAALNSFNKKRRISVLMLSNNINQQNFSTSDITGAIGSSGRDFGGGQGGGRQAGNNQGGANSLMVNPLTGNTTTHSGGINYTDHWGKKLNVSSSYFYNYALNNQQSKIVRNYFANNGLVYKQNNDYNTTNQNHRFNLRLEYEIDSVNKITWSPSFTSQGNIFLTNLTGTNSLADQAYLIVTKVNSQNKNQGYELSSNLLFQHKFKKPGRTLSIQTNPQLSEKINPGNYFSSNSYSDTVSFTLDQEYHNYSYTKKLPVNLSYTEPVLKHGQLQLNYNPSVSENKSVRTIEDYNFVSNEYNNFNSSLSNKYDNFARTQKGGVAYKYQKTKLNFNIGADMQQVFFSGEQFFPYTTKVKYTFQNVLPNASFNYRYSKSKNLRVNYRSSTNIPSVAQLQNVLDVSNPLIIKSGNTSLKQTTDHNVHLRFGGFNPNSSRNLMIFLNGNYVYNYITTANYIAVNDSLIGDYVIKSGSQLTKPINLNGYNNTRMFVVYGFPFKFIKSNVNLNTGINYSRTPSLIYNILNYSNSYATNSGIYIGSNISEKLDFSVSYNNTYTMVKNTSQKKSNNNFLTHSASIKVNWVIRKVFVINTDITYNIYQGLSQSFNQQYFLWNGYVAYKLLKNKSLEAKIYIFDILKQNLSINRIINNAYSEDSKVTVLQRYGTFTLTYTIRNFKNGSPPTANPENSLLPGGMPPGMHKQRDN